MAMAVAPLLAEAMKGGGGEGTMITFTYHGGSKWWAKHIPKGLTFSLQTWFVALLLAIGGLTAVIVFLGGVTKALEKLGVKSSKPSYNVFDVMFPPLGIGKALGLFK